jgi:hypothetical protein
MLNFNTTYLTFAFFLLPAAASSLASINFLAKSGLTLGNYPSQAKLSYYLLRRRYHGT